MFHQETPPASILSLAGTGTDDRERMDRQNDQDTQIIQTKTMTGNRCGHIPGSPRYFQRPDHHKARPYVIQLAMEKVKDISCRPKALFNKILVLHCNGRRIRSERREAFTLVSQVLLHYLDLESLRVGFRVSTNKFLYLDLNYISKKAGISFIRTKRAVSDMVKAGYLNASRQFNRKDDGTFSGSASIRQLTIKFFSDLGMDLSQLYFAREWKRRKNEKESASATHKKLKGIIGAASMFTGKAKPFFSNMRKPVNQKSVITKYLINQALNLYKQNPNRLPSVYLKELQIVDQRINT